MRVLIVYIFICFIGTAGFAQTKCMNGDCEDGYGTAVVKDGTEKYFYVGYFKKGKFEGFGEVETTTRDGKITYKGDFKDGKYNGSGMFRQESGTNVYKYNGLFKNGKYHGRGTYEIQDKRDKSYEVREGYFKDDQISGFSKVFTDKFTYVGNLENGVREGLGMIEYKDGTSYRGYFKNNKYDELGQFNSGGRFNCAGQVTDGKCCIGINLSSNDKGDYFIGMTGDTTFGMQIYSDSDDYYIGYMEGGEKKGAGVLWSKGIGTFQSWNKDDPEYPEKYSFNLKNTKCVTGDCNKGLNVMIYDSLILTCNFNSLKPYGFAVLEYMDGRTLYGMVDSLARLKDSFAIMETRAYTYFGYLAGAEFLGRGIILENKSQIVYVGDIQGMKPNGLGFLIDGNNIIMNFGIFENGKFIGEIPQVTEEPEVIKFNLDEEATDEDEESEDY